MPDRVRPIATVVTALAILAGGPLPNRFTARPRAQDAPATPVTLLVVNGRVWTGDRARPWAEAVAVSGDRLAAVGTTADVRARAAGAATAREIDARGALVGPGLIDAHVHFLEGGHRLSSVSLRDAASREAFVRRIGAFAATRPAGTWITGGDWDHSLWGGVLPDRAWIDAVTPTHPVWVNRLDGHMALANTAALRAAGLEISAPREVEGGTVDRDAEGRITGLLRDNAMALVDRVVPPASDEDDDRALDAAMRYVAERGVTSVHHMGTWRDLAVFERAHVAGRLATRIYAAVPLDTWPRLAETIAARTAGASGGRGDDWLRIGALKGFVDGSLGSHTAAFIEPFTDKPDDRGLLVNTPEALARLILGADKSGLHVAVHAIGDRANRLLLDLYEQAARANGPRDRRFRIEHAQHLAPADIPRFARNGVIASMQPYHAIDDGRWAEALIGRRRAEGTYAFRSLIDTGAHVAFGSDWYVAPPTPLEGLYAAVTRRTLDGAHPDGWVPAQRVALEEALRAYTAGGAYASFEDDRKGRLTPGMLADLVVLDRDLFGIPPEQISEARVRFTVVGGRVVYER